MQDLVAFLTCVSNDSLYVLDIIRCASLKQYYYATVFGRFFAPWGAGYCFFVSVFPVLSKNDYARSAYNPDRLWGLDRLFNHAYGDRCFFALIGFGNSEQGKKATKKQQPVSPLTHPLGGFCDQS